MRNQFFYTRKVTIAPEKEGDEPIVKEYQDSFNVNKVIRTLSLEDGTVVVLLDDMHERAQEVPNVNPKTRKVIGTKMQRQTVQTEIVLENEFDIIRFKDFTQIS